MLEKYLDKKFFTLFLLPFIIGSITVFSFQPFNLTFVNFLVLPIFFYLIIYIKKKSKSKFRKRPFRRNLFIFGVSFGFGFYLSGTHWISNSLTFDENFMILIPFALLLIPLFLSLFFAIVTVLIGPYLNLNFGSIFLFSGTLAVSDYLRAKILTGFPWNLWSYSLSWATEVLQILDLVGIFAFNLIIITLFMLPAILFLRINILKKIFLLGLLPLIFLILYIYGNHSINQNYRLIKLNQDKFNIKIISPNFKLNYGLSEEDIEDRLKKLIRFSAPEKNSKVIFIWPEGVFSGYNFSQIYKFKKIFLENFDDKHLILFGVNNFEIETGKVFNSLVVVDNNLEILREYRKQKLVPFGEFLPFEKILSNFGLKKITEGYGSFSKGKKQNNIEIENMSILPLICYELIFPEFVQRSPQKTNLIVNISEDGWFGNSLGPYQHFAKGIFRAIEQNSYLVRSANKGISAIINNKGEVIKKLNIHESGNIDLEVPLIRSKNKNKNDLIFFILLFTYILIFKYYEKINVKK